jgi:hypothetical protein
VYKNWILDVDQLALQYNVWPMLAITVAIELSTVHLD